MEEEIREILNLAEILARDFARKHGIYYLLDELISVSRYAVATALRKVGSKRSYWKYVRLRIRGELISFWRRWTDFSRTKKKQMSQYVYLEDLFRDKTEDNNKTWEDFLPGDPIHPEEVLERKELQESVHRAVDMLPDKHKRVIKGIYYEGKTGKEIAKEMGLTEGRVSQLHKEGIRQLRDMLM